jgi:hypothetical protein
MTQKFHFFRSYQKACGVTQNCTYKIYLQFFPQAFVRSNVASGAVGINSLTPELNPSAQLFLPRYFTGGS